MEAMDEAIEPIYPCILRRVGSGSRDFRLYKDGDPKDYLYPMEGLTKREYFAGLALQGILAGDTNQRFSMDNVQSAVEYADKLLKELRKR